MLALQALYSYGNSVRLSVRPSVCHTPVLCHTDYTRSTVQFALSDSKMCLALQKPKKYSPGTTHSPEILAQRDLPPPDSSES